MKRFLMVIMLVLMMIGYAPAADRIIYWDMNTESDLKGYKIYRANAPNVTAEAGNLWLTIYKPGENPDTGNMGNAEYVVGPAGECVLARNIIPDGTYFFVLTAFDVALNESGVSNEVTTIIDDTAPAPPTGCMISSP